MSDTQKERSLKIITWAYLEGFKAAARTIDMTAQTLNVEELEKKFESMFDAKPEVADAPVDSSEE